MQGEDGRGVGTIQLPRKSSALMENRSCEWPDVSNTCIPLNIDRLDSNGTLTGRIGRIIFRLVELLV